MIGLNWEDLIVLIRRKELEQESFVESIEVILVCSEKLTSLRLNCSVMLSDQVISHYLKTYPFCKVTCTGAFFIRAKLQVAMLGAAIFPATFVNTRITKNPEKI